MRKQDQEWHDIPGYNGWYQINHDGEVRAVGHWRTPRLLKCRTNKFKDNAVTVQLRRPDGKCRHEYVLRLMVRTFIGEQKPGLKAYHKDKNNLNNALYNIGFTTQSELGKMFGGFSRKPVAKVDCDGEVVEVYKSIREAGKKNFIDYNQVSRICAGKATRPYDENGCTFRLIDDIVRDGGEW